MTRYSSFDVWYSEGQRLAEEQDRNKEAIGHWVVDGDAQFGEQAAQAWNLFNEFTITNYASAVRRTPDSVMPANPRRRVGMSARQAAAPLYDYPEAQRVLLQKYGNEEINRDELREQVTAFQERVNPADSRPDHAGVSEPVIEWHEVDTLETVAGEESSLWHKLMGMLIHIARGHKIRITIYEAEEQRLDRETGDVVNG